jgi:hypothetical protein
MNMGVTATTASSGEMRVLDTVEPGLQSVTTTAACAYRIAALDG